MRVLPLTVYLAGLGLATAIRDAGEAPAHPLEVEAPEVLAEIPLWDAVTRGAKAVVDTVSKPFINTDVWPFTNNAKALFDQAMNTANSNAGQIVEILKTAGANTANIASMSTEVAANTARSLQNSNLIMGLTSTVASNSDKIAGLTSSMTLLTGSVATNTANIAALSTQVATMGQVTGPTVALAASLGVAPGTVASLALAGSFAGPLIGVIALVVACWPEEEVDPWLKIEKRVAALVSDKFDSVRRKRLSNRLKRYVNEFSRCAQAWVSENMVVKDGLMMGVGVAQKISSNSAEMPVPQGAVPPCMARLETMLTVEQDEWLDTDKGTLSGLFMPFANLHTQVLALLKDNPPETEKYMQYENALQVVSAHYSEYILQHLLKAFKAQMCRTVRLRHAGNFLQKWEYQFVVLKPQYQPHAAEDCFEACSGTSGWCNFCGGKGTGACCKKGDTGTCAQFDPPVGQFSGQYHSCVHTDAKCIQSNTAYWGTEVGRVDSKTMSKGRIDGPEECQNFCRWQRDAVAFTWALKAEVCTCYASGGLYRRPGTNFVSGPVNCEAPHEDALAGEEDAISEGLEELYNVPVVELTPCTPSPRASSWEDLERRHPEWVAGCMRNTTKAVTYEFNPFYKRFGQFIDRLSLSAKCGALRSSTEDIWHEAAEALDGGSFDSCDWEVEEEEGDEYESEGVYKQDRVRSQGFFLHASSINMDEQKLIKSAFPLPKWLHYLRSLRSCLQHSKAPNAQNPDRERTAVIANMLRPIASDKVFRELSKGDEASADSLVQGSQEAATAQDLIRRMLDRGSVPQV